MAQYQKLRVFFKPLTYRYDVPDYSDVNAFLEFIGNKVQHVQVLEHEKTARFFIVVRYKTSTNFEPQVEDYINNS